MRKLLVILLLTGIAVAPAQAKYALRGKVACKDVVRENDHRHYRQYNLWWLLGYVSARNYVAASDGGNGMVGKDVETEKLYETALEFCRANPAKDWNDAVRSTYEGLK